MARVSGLALSLSVFQMTMLSQHIKTYKVAMLPQQSESNWQPLKEPLLPSKKTGVKTQTLSDFAGLSGSSGGGGSDPSPEVSLSAPQFCADETPADFRLPHQVSPTEDPLIAWIRFHQRDYAACCFGRVIPEGSCGFTLKNGKVGVVASGRRYIMDPLTRLLRIESLNTNLIQIQTEGSCPQLSIVRVQTGEELYELRAPHWQYVKLVDMMTEHIKMDDRNSLDIVRVLPGKLGLYYEGGQPKVLVARAESYHLQKPEKQFVSLVDQNKEHISLGSLNIITVATGRRGVVWVRGNAQLVEEGQVQLAQ
eukprot:gene15794-18726_t